MESESHALGCHAQGLCDFGVRPAVEAALIEHLEVELRDLSGERGEDTPHLGLCRETLAFCDRSGTTVHEIGRILNYAPRTGTGGEACSTPGSGPQ